MSTVVPRYRRLLLHCEESGRRACSLNVHDLLSEQLEELVRLVVLLLADRPAAIVASSLVNPRFTFIHFLQP